MRVLPTAGARVWKRGKAMRVYLKQQTAPGRELFRAFDVLGNPVYTILCGEKTLTGKMLLLDNKQEIAVKISRIGPETFSRYTILEKGRPSVRLYQNMAVLQPVYQLLGISWKFRGNITARSFDLIEPDGAVVMSHGVCWRPGGNVFCLDIARERDVPLCVAISAVIDSVIPPGLTAAVPVRAQG